MGAGGLIRGRKKSEISAAELDLRLLSEKASRSFKLSSFDLWLAKYNLVAPWVFLLMLVSYGLQIGALVLEELSDFSVSIFALPRPVFVLSAILSDSNMTKPRFVLCPSGDGPHLRGL